MVDFRIGLVTYAETFKWFIVQYMQYFYIMIWWYESVIPLISCSCFFRMAWPLWNCFRRPCIYFAMHRNTSLLEYMLVHINGIQSWVTTTLVVPHINYGKLKFVACLVTLSIQWFHATWKSIITHRYPRYSCEQYYNDLPKPFGGWKQYYMRQYEPNVKMCGTEVDINYRINREEDGRLVILC